MIKLSQIGLLLPLYELLRGELIQQTVLYTDETPYQILNQVAGKPTTSQSRIWLLRTIKHAEHPVATTILEGFKGYLYCDGYSVYKNIPNMELFRC